MYCAPLRLLAWEIFDNLNEANVQCDLITGQEVIRSEDTHPASHVSCTVEMASVDRRLDCGVIDEIQLLGSQDRGWAWTRALLGLQCRELHLCGDVSSEQYLHR
jgi:ATP-dependent RNA helicase SUPV3L1/SUV3